MLLLQAYPGWLTQGQPLVLEPSGPVVNNPARIVAPPVGFRPNVPRGFTVSVLARGFQQPRWLAVAPGGEVLVADSQAGQIVCLAGTVRAVLADHLALPFGLAIHDRWLHVAEHDAVSRFRFEDCRHGRPVGVAVAKDGALLVSDDGAGLIWRVGYQQ